MVVHKRRGRPTKPPAAGDARASLGLRVTAKLKRDLDEAARASGRSQSQEAELRLERSFLEEQALGGGEMLAVARMMAANFAFAGRQAATAKGHKDWTAKEWLADHNCYRSAFLAVATNLLGSAPDQSREAVSEMLQTLIRRADSLWKISTAPSSNSDLEGG